jgi:AmiR/NasT family two-component response regulator
VPNARSLLEEALETRVEHIGFKDVGLPETEMRGLVEAIRDAGRTAHLEVVSLTAEAELTSARTAVDLGVDYLIGGSHWRDVKPLLAGTEIAYFPYVGTVFDHPGKLDGTPEQIRADIAAMGDAVDGVNLLAYRHVDRDGADLLREVTEGLDVPLIAAGSIDSPERIRAVSDAGAWAFTIGQAALDGRLVDGGGLREQLETILDAAAATTGQGR